MPHETPPPQAPPLETKSLTRGQVAMLIFILLAGAFFRFYRIGGPSLWLDELWSIEISTGRGSLHDFLPTGAVQTRQVDLTSLQDAPAWWNIWTTLAGVTHPPLYHVVLRWWMDMFGNGAIATRALSAIFSIAGIALLFDICLRLHGPRVALWACAFLAMSPAQLAFAQQARSYTMLMLLGLCCADLLVRIEKSGASPLRVALLAVFLAAMGLTHYFCLGAAAALLVYALVRHRGRDLVLTLAAFSAGAAIIALLWGPWFFAQVRSLPSMTPDFLTDLPARHWQLSALRLLNLPYHLLIGKSDSLALTRVDPVSILMAFIAVGLPCVLWLRGRRDLLLWVLWVSGNIGFILLFDLVHGSRTLDILRYTILASPGLCVLLAGILGPTLRLWRVALVGCAFALIAGGTLFRSFAGAAGPGDYQQFAHAVDAYVPPGDLLVFYNDSPWLSPGTWYLGLRYYSPGSNRPWVILKGPADEQLLRQLRAYNSLWLIGVDPIAQSRTLLPGWKPFPFVVIHNNIGTAYQMIPQDRMAPIPAGG